MKYAGVAISGKAGAGKTAVAKELDDFFVVDFAPSRIMRLADEIYQEAYAQGMPRGEKDRPLLQSIGDARTAVEPSYYARKLVENRRRAVAGYAEKGSREPLVAIVDDLRKVVEAEYLRQQGFALVRLEAFEHVRNVRLLQRDGSLQEAALSHWTETDLDNYDRWDLKVPNNGFQTAQQVALFIYRSLGFDRVVLDGE